MGAIKTKTKKKFKKAKVTESPAMLPVFPLAEGDSLSVAPEGLVPDRNGSL